MRSLTVELLLSVAAPKPDMANINSILTSLARYGHDVGLDQPHRYIQYLAQLAHESGGFKYDREIWGPTSAQERYDIRADLGNTPERDGDGYKYRGRTGIQLTGRRNYLKFYQWCVKQGYNPPDFVQNPDVINQDPWEGLVPIWYWSEATGKSLNVYADQGNNEMVTRKINGGLNGYSDRLERYSKLGMAFLGYTYDKKGLEAFQTAAKNKGIYDGDIDGDDGPKTRAAIHQSLVQAGSLPIAATKPAPVTENVPVAPQGAERTAMVRTFGATGFLSTMVGFFADIPAEYKVLLALLSVVAIVVIVAKAELIASRVKSAIKAFGLGN